VICSDKTGTLTKNEMTVTAFPTGMHEVDITGIGYTPEGKFRLQDQTVDAKQSAADALHQTIALSTNAYLQPGERQGSMSVMGIPPKARCWWRHRRWSHPY
jgi:Ca2+-transporting ATPase